MTAPENFAADIPPEPDATKVAQMLIVGFMKFWTLRQLLDAFGICPNGDDEFRQLHDRFKFLPADKFCYITKRSTPIRALVSHEWPRLHDYLDRNANDPVKLLRAAPEITKLICRDKARSTRSVEDAKEFNAARKELRRVTTANRAARKQQLSTQRGAWNVCKP